MNEIYQKNIEIIKELNKGFSEKLLSCIHEKHQNIEIVSNSNFLIKQGSKEILAYPHDKEKDILDDNLKNINLHNDECTIQIGIGNGFVLHHLLKKSKEKHVIILIEVIPQLLNMAFENYDYSKKIKNGNLIICGSKEEFQNIMSLLESTKVTQYWHNVIENYTVLLSNIYGDLTKFAMNTINNMLCNIGTVMGAGKIIAENDIKNLPYVIKHRGVNEIKDLFKGKPAIVILSAPTVIKLLPQLIDQKIRDKIIIIAIAQMLRPLLAFEIKPDFICTVDYGEVNYEHFDNLWHVDDIPLVALNRSYAPILEKWNGPKFIVTGLNPAPKESIIEMLNHKGQLEQGGSVGHMALGLAIHLGCNPIIHIGFDCAYDENEKLSHNKLGDAVGRLEFNKDGTLDWEVNDPNSLLKNNIHKMGNTVYVPGYFGRPVPTNMGLASFITSMEDIFNRYQNLTFINACEGGAKKKYCIQMSLKKALKLYCRSKIKKEKINKYLTLLPDYKKDIEDAKKRLRWEIDLFEKEINACDSALKPLKKMEKASKDQLKLLLAENEKHAIASQNFAKQSNLLALHIYETSREIHKKELNVNGKTNHLLKDKNDLEIRIKRSEKILSAAKKSALKLKQIYEDVLEKISNNNFVNNLEIKDRPTINYTIDNWYKLIENGNWARPLLESYFFGKKSTDPQYLQIYWDCLDLKMDCIKEGLERKDLTDLIDYNNYIDNSKEHGLKRNFNMALKYLKKANKLYPDLIESRWGLATVYQHLNKTKESIKIYESLIKDYPDNNRFKFELGQVYLTVDFHKGLKLIEDILEKTNEFDSFYLRLAELEFEVKNYHKAESHCKKYLSVYSHSENGKELLKKIQNENKSK